MFAVAEDKGTPRTALLFSGSVHRLQSGTVQKCLSPKFSILRVVWRVVVKRGELESVGRHLMDV